MVNVQITVYVPKTSFRIPLRLPWCVSNLTDKSNDVFLFTSILIQRSVHVQSYYLKLFMVLMHEKTLCRSYQQYNNEKYPTKSIGIFQPSILLYIYLFIVKYIANQFCKTNIIHWKVFSLCIYDLPFYRNPFGKAPIRQTTGRKYSKWLVFLKSKAKTFWFFVFNSA